MGNLTAIGAGTIGSLMLSGHTIQTASGDITLSPYGALNISTLTVSGGIPYTTDTSGAITNDANLT